VVRVVVHQTTTQVEQVVLAATDVVVAVEAQVLHHLQVLEVEVVMVL
jgi:hypothetical protein